MRPTGLTIGLHRCKSESSRVDSLPRPLAPRPGLGDTLQKKSHCKTKQASQSSTAGCVDNTSRKEADASARHTGSFSSNTAVANTAVSLQAVERLSTEQSQTQDFDTAHTKVHVHSDVSQTATARRALQTASTQDSNLAASGIRFASDLTSAQIAADPIIQAGSRQQVVSVVTGEDRVQGALTCLHSTEANHENGDQLGTGAQLSLEEKPTERGPEPNEDSQGQDNSPARTAAARRTLQPEFTQDSNLAASGIRFASDLTSAQIAADPIIQAGSRQQVVSVVTGEDRVQGALTCLHPTEANRESSDQLGTGAQLPLEEEPTAAGRELNEDSQDQDSSPAHAAPTQQHAAALAMQTTDMDSSHGLHPNTGCTEEPRVMNSSLNDAHSNESVAQGDSVHPCTRRCVDHAEQSSPYMVAGLLQKPGRRHPFKAAHKVDYKALSEASLSEWPGTMDPSAHSSTGHNIVGTLVEQRDNWLLSKLRNLIQGITTVGLCLDRRDAGFQCTDNSRSVLDNQDTSSVRSFAGGSGSGVSATQIEYYNIVQGIMQAVPQGVLCAAVHRDPADRAAFALCDDESFVAVKLGTENPITGTVDAASLHMVTLILQVATPEMIRDALRHAPTASGAITSTDSNPEVVHEIRIGSACVINRHGNCIRHCSIEIEDWQSSESVYEMVRALKAGHEVVTTRLLREEGQAYLIGERWFPVNIPIHAGMSEQEQRVVVQASDPLHLPIGTFGFIFNLFNGVVRGTVAEDPDCGPTMCFECGEEEVHFLIPKSDDGTPICIRCFNKQQMSTHYRFIRRCAKCDGVFGAPQIHHDDSCRLVEYSDVSPGGTIYCALCCTALGCVCAQHAGRFGDFCFQGREFASGTYHWNIIYAPWSRRFHGVVSSTQKHMQMQYEGVHDMLQCALRLIGQELDAASVSWREMSKKQIRLDYIWEVLLHQPARIIAGLGSGLLRGLSAFQLRPDYRGLSPLFGPEGFPDTQTNVFGDCSRMDVLSFQYKLHRLILALAAFPPGTVYWEDVLLGGHSWLDRYAFGCTECIAGCNHCSLSICMRRQSYRIGAPSGSVTFGEDGCDFTDKVIYTVTDIIFQARRWSGSPLESLELNTFFRSGDIPCGSDRMRGYIEELARQAVGNIPEYVLRSWGDSTSGTLNALQYMLNRPDYGDGRLFLIFHPGVHHGLREEHAYILKLGRILVRISYAPLGTISMATLMAEFETPDRCSDTAVCTAPPAPESQLGGGGGSRRDSRDHGRTQYWFRALFV